MADIHPWPKPGPTAPLPRPLKRPCDRSLEGAVSALETQLGTIEAYNHLVAMAGHLRRRIEMGDTRAQNALYARDVLGAAAPGARRREGESGERKATADARWRR